MTQTCCSLPMRPFRTSSTASLKLSFAPLLSADLNDSACLFDYLAQLFAFVDGQRERFFGVDILAGPAGGNTDGRVPVVGSAIDDDIDVIPLEQFAVVGVQIGPIVKSRFGPFGLSAVHVADGNDVAKLGRVPGVLKPASADTDGADVRPIVGRCRFAGNAARNAAGYGLQRSTRPVNRRSGGSRGERTGVRTRLDLLV